MTVATGTGRLVDVGDTRLFVAEAGEGTPIVALHGGMGLDHTYLRPWLDGLGDVARMVYVDQRGNGRSPAGRPLAEVDMATWADDVDALCHSLGLDQAVLFGHSYGGFVALECALRHPDRIAALILCGTSASFDHGDAINKALDRRGATDAQRQAFTGAPFTSDEEYRDWLTIATPLYLHPGSSVDLDLSGMRFCVETLARGADFLHGWDRRPYLSQIAAPALVLAGRHDFVMPVEEAMGPLAEGLAGATCVVFEHSGHLPFIEEPERFTRVVRTWLASLPSTIDNPRRSP